MLEQLLIAGPSFEGFDQHVWNAIVVLAVRLSASAYATIRIGKVCGTYERLGLPFWGAAIITVGGLLWAGTVVVMP